MDGRGVYVEDRDFHKGKKLRIKSKKSLKKVDFFARLNIIRLTEPNTPLNDADHVGSFNFKEIIVWEN